MAASGGVQEPEIRDSTKVCLSLPTTQGIQIKRDNILHSLETILESEALVVVVEGKEGFGKTTLLAQFAARNCARCASIFVKPTSRFTYDPAILLADFCNQLHWILYGHEYQPSAAVDEAMFRRLLIDFQKKTGRSCERFYFVVDGLEEIPRDSAQVQALILGMLPLGLPRFKFLFSGNAEDILKHFAGPIHHKPFTLPAFTFEDTIAYFSGLGISREAIEEIYKVCKGVPGYLASIRRIIESGTAVETLIYQLPSSIPEIFEVEWKAVDEANGNLLSLLALVAHDKKGRPLGELSKILELDVELVRSLLKPLTFVKEINKDEAVEFVSEAYRRFVAARLTRWRDPIRLKLIDYLLTASESHDALALLPAYLQEAGRLDDLLAYLSPDHFAVMIQRSQSLVTVQQKAEMGLKTALELGRDGDLLRFGIQKSTLTRLDTCGVLRSEIDARLALGQYQSAMNLAQSAVLKQDRLRMLALIARFQRQEGFSPEPEVIDQIDVLFKDIEHFDLDDDLIELASDLMYSRPDLAIHLVEENTTAAPDDREVDWALARLSVIAAVGRHRGQSGMASKAEEIRVKIKDQAVFQLSTAIPVISGGYSSGEVINELEKVSNPIHRLFLLRQWALHTENDKNIADVLQYALDLAIKTTQYTPHAGHLRELATPLPLISDPGRIRELVSIFDAQKGTVERLGPTEDCVRLQLTLAQSEARYDVDTAVNRLIETYLYVSDLKDLETKTACLARIVAATILIDPSLTNKDCTHIHVSALKGVENQTEELLRSTGDHYWLFR